MVARLRVEGLERDEQMPPRSPGVRGAARLLAIPEAIGGDTAMADRTLELSGGLLVQPRGVLEIVLTHSSRSSAGNGTGTSSEKPAYATLGSDVSSSTPAPCLSAVSFTG